MGCHSNSRVSDRACFLKIILDPVGGRKGASVPVHCAVQSDEEEENLGVPLLRAAS